jgi:hypothetical protein
VQGGNSGDDSTLAAAALLPPAVGDNTPAVAAIPLLFAEGIGAAVV